MASLRFHIAALQTRRAMRAAVGCALLLALVLNASGCTRMRYLAMRRAPHNPLAGPLQLVSRSGPRPSPRTEQFLRRYDLAGLQQQQPEVVLTRLQEEIEREPSPDKLYSYAEVSYVVGKRLEAQKKSDQALHHYGAAVANSYRFLFDPLLDRFRNPYDPQFRRACDVYNSALEAGLRIVRSQGKLKPGGVTRIQVGDQPLEIKVVLRGPWSAAEIERLEFVSDFEVEDGLTNQYHTYGLGVPLIAVRSKTVTPRMEEKYYPPGLSFPVTAFLRLSNAPPRSDGCRECLLELYDPLYASDLRLADRLVPLETDLSIPLAYFLDSPVFKDHDITTVGLLDPAKAQGIKGLYMLEPFDPQRIPVVMVHGLWSSPTTWMEMFNDLRAFPEIRDKFQFWFYQYPTGQPFWVSAMQMREALAEVRQTVDPHEQTKVMEQMVLVGHSMGGLVSRLQTIESGDDFWRILSDKPFNELSADPQEKERLAKIVYFHPNPGIKRIVTIGTPHQGSTFANEYTRYFARRLIKLPEFMVSLNNELVRENVGLFRNTDLITTTTILDSLAPSSPIFPVLLRARAAPETRLHNIVGVLSRSGFVAQLSEEGDGVVSYQSAHLIDADSELIVNADHLNVHRHPLSILEVRRILLEHEQELRAARNPDLIRLPAVSAN
jgi:hypothetical protein